VLIHHAFVRAELPRLLPMAEKAARKHGPTHPELTQVHQQLELLADDLLMHLYKEERVLFRTSRAWSGRARVRRAHPRRASAACRARFR